MMKDETKKKLFIAGIAAFGLYLLYEHHKASQAASNDPGAMIPDCSGGANFTDNGLMAPGNRMAPLYIDKEKLSIEKTDFVIRYKLGVIPHTV